VAANFGEVTGLGWGFRIESADGNDLGVTVRVGGADRRTFPLYEQTCTGSQKVCGAAGFTCAGPICDFAVVFEPTRAGRHEADLWIGSKHYLVKGQALPPSTAGRPTEPPSTPTLSVPASTASDTPSPTSADSPSR
jgi:hypothetical protein